MVFLRRCIVSLNRWLRYRNDTAADAKRFAEAPLALLPAFIGGATALVEMIERGTASVHGIGASWTFVAGIPAEDRGVGVRQPGQRLQREHERC